VNHSFERFFVREIAKICNVPVRYDQHVPAVVREEVHNDEASFSALNDQSFIVETGLLRLAKYALTFCRGRLGKGADVLGSPGREEFLHIPL